MVANSSLTPAQDSTAEIVVDARSRGRYVVCIVLLAMATLNLRIIQLSWN